MLYNVIHGKTAIKYFSIFLFHQMSSYLLTVHPHKAQDLIPFNTEENIRYYASSILSRSYIWQKMLSNIYIYKLINDNT